MKFQQTDSPRTPFLSEMPYVWAIGIYLGESPLKLAAYGSNPVLTYLNITDIEAAFVADPFMLKTQDEWYMFFEVFNRACNKGEIALAVSHNGLDWEYRRRVLIEPHHLSYPYVFEWQGVFYMIPETLSSRSIQLYKAHLFPFEWTAVATLVEGEYADPSIVHFEGRWWLFACPDPLKNRTLRLFFADKLFGPWTEHPQSPIVVDNERLARPAGRLLIINNKVIRFSQDCYPMYGSQVRAFQITRLTPDTYREVECEESPLLKGQGSGWNEVGMHHVDAFQISERKWLACVDGMRKGI
jgi:hypothetical protein